MNDPSTATPKRLSEIGTVHEGAILEDVTLGAWTEVGAHAYLEHVTFGAYAYCGPFAFLQNVTVGPFANLAAAIRLGPTAHPMDRPTQHHVTYRRVMYGVADHDDEAFFAWRRSQRTEIGPDTWIGHGAIVMPGVRVGTGAVVGAGAVVTRDVPNYTVAVGVPARVVKRRFAPEVAEALERIAWWTWDHDRITAAIDDLSGPGEAFVEAYLPAADGEGPS